MKNYFQRNGKRIEQNIKMDDGMKTLLNKTKNEKKRKNENLDIIKQLENELVQIKYDNNPNLS